MDKKDRRAFLITLMLGVLMSALDSSVVSLTMPRIMKELPGAVPYSWPFLSYQAASTLAIMLFSAVSEFLGRRPIYTLGLLVFLAASGLCAVSPSLEVLVVFRFFQGLGAGIVISTSFTLVSLNFPIAERGKYIGYLSAMFAVASLAGPPVGGLVGDVWGWPWIFLLNLPLGAAALLWSLPGFRSVPRETPRTGRFDTAGSVCFSFSAGALVLLFGAGGKDFAWVSVPALVLAGAFVLFFILFLWVEHRAPNPLLPPSLFLPREFNLAFGAALLGSVLFFSGLLLFPLYLQSAFHWSAARTSGVITPLVLAFVGGTFASGRVIRRFRTYRPLALGASGAVLLALAVLGLTPAGNDPVLVTVVGAVWALGLGLCTPVYSVAAQNAHQRQKIGPVNGSIQFVRNLGSSLGAALLGWGLALWAGGHRSIDPEGFRFLIQVQLVPALAYFACLFFFRRGLRLPGRGTVPHSG